jgi:hypothetical protein
MDNAGGVWVVLFILCFPFSLLITLLELGITQILPLKFSNEFTLFHLFIYVLGGTAWYYWLTKTLTCYFCRPDKMKHSQNPPVFGMDSDLDSNH